MLERVVLIGAQRVRYTDQGRFSWLPTSANASAVRIMCVTDGVEFLHKSEENI